jgi:hypothetical protein
METIYDVDAIELLKTQNLPCNDKSIDDTFRKYSVMYDSRAMEILYKYIKSETILEISNITKNYYEKVNYEFVQIIYKIDSQFDLDNNNKHVLLMCCHTGDYKLFKLLYDRVGHAVWDIYMGKCATDYGHDNIYNFIYQL